jgi:hypothetical protein
VIATWTEIAAAAPLGFLVGVLIGFVLSNRYRIVKRNGDQ